MGLRSGRCAIFALKRKIVDPLPESATAGKFYGSFHLYASYMVYMMGARPS